MTALASALVPVPVSAPRPPVDAEILRLLTLVDTSADPSERLDAIGALARRGDADSCRVLVEVYARSRWQATRVALLRAVGACDQQRGTELLLRVAQGGDWGLASEAMLALGATNSPAAGEFLLTVLQQRGHPLRREAVLALARMRYFPCDRELAALLEEEEALSPALLQCLILSLGRRGQRAFWPLVERFLDPSLLEKAPALFEAALVAAGQLGGEDALRKLKSFAAPSHLLASELRLAAIERLRARMRRPLEETVAELVEASDPLDRWQALRQLRSFPRERALAAFERHRDEGTPTLECLVRAALFDPLRDEDDRAFLTRAAGTIEWNAAAWLVDQHLAVGGRDFCESLYAALPRRVACQLMSRVREDAAPERLRLWIADATAPLPERVQAVNALVAQAQMAGRRSTGAAACVSGVLELLGPSGRAGEGALRHRLVRALGQIGIVSTEALALLEAELARGGPAAMSAYAALATLEDPRAAEVVLRRLEKVWVEADADAEVDAALATLARFERLPRVGPIESVVAKLLAATAGGAAAAGAAGAAAVAPGAPWRSSFPAADPRRRRRLALLQILASNAVPGAEPLIAAALEAGDVQSTLLGLEAVRLNPAGAPWEKVAAQLESPDPGLAARALEAIAAAGGPAEHERLLATLGPELAQREHVLAVLRRVVPRDGGDYTAAIERLEGWLATREGVFAERDVRAAVLQLRDGLVAAHASPAARRDGTRGVARLDAELAARLPRFSSFGAGARGALRHAELVWGHAELFGAPLDRSLAAVAYARVVDLLLRERLVAQLSRGGPALAAQLQSRLIELQLHEASSRPVVRLLRDLGLEEWFDPGSFPLEELTALTRAVLDGALSRDPMAVLSGLRAEALALVLFARRFRQGPRSLEPLLKIAIPDAPVIGALAANLTALEDRRDETAGRDGVARPGELEEIRARSFELLHELERVLVWDGPPTSMEQEA